MCLVCGLENDFGLKASFYELENDELLAMFTPGYHHQGYPGRLHGGIISTILDETIGRAVMIEHKDAFWGVTLEITVRLKKPVPLGETIRVLGRITKDSRRIFAGSGEIFLTDGTIAATATGKYMKMPLEKIAEFDHEHEKWKVVSNDTDPEFVDLPT